jgi:ABC-type transporter Mla subunit MlaD
MSYFADSLPLQPPPQHRPPAVVEAATKLERLYRARDDMSSLLQAVTDKLEQAVEDDRRRLPDAYADESAKPDRKAVQKLEDELAARRRDLDALDLAVSDARKKVAEAIDAHREAWRAALEAERASARAGLSDAIDALERAHQRVGEFQGAISFLTSWPRVPTYAAGTRPVLELRGRNGEPYNWPTVLAALRTEARPPEPPPPPPKPPSADALRGVPRVGPRRREAVEEGAA